MFNGDVLGMSRYVLKRTSTKSTRQCLVGFSLVNILKVEERALESRWDLSHVLLHTAFGYLLGVANNRSPWCRYIHMYTFAYSGCVL